MTNVKLNRSYNLRGFTLVELIMVIMLLSVSSAVFVSLLGQMGVGVRSNKDTQAAAQLAQECGEYLLALRRIQGYVMGGVSDCSSLGAFGADGPAAVTLTEPYLGNGCPVGAACKLFDVAVSVGSGAARVQLILVDY
ncbi:MAG: type II secretion system GspH family protein [Gammaproteobacteria bacterium]|nr:type II secretion system GspH family protein [Gammaproteobacteria bacterium]MDH5800256.1 type II secretion system GspH family protein [Gammaproteobacteria bacterium]